MTQEIGCDCGPNTMIPRPVELAEERQEMVENRPGVDGMMIVNMPFIDEKEQVVHSPASPFNKGINILG